VFATAVGAGAGLVTTAGGVFGWKRGLSVAGGLLICVVVCVGTSDGAVVNGGAFGVIALCVLPTFAIIATIFPGIVNVCPVTTSFTSASESPFGNEVCFTNLTRRSGCPAVRMINAGLSSAAPAASAAGEADTPCEEIFAEGACAIAGGANNWLASPRPVAKAVVFRVSQPIIAASPVCCAERHL